MSEELQSQTQQAASSGAEVDEHAITRSVLGEQRGHEKAIGRILKSIKSSSSSTTASRASCAPGSSSTGPTYEAFVAVKASHNSTGSLRQCSNNLWPTLLPNCRHGCLIFSSPLPSWNFPILINNLIRIRKEMMMRMMRKMQI